MVGTVPLLYGKNSLFTGTQVILLAGIVAIAIIAYFALVFSNRRRNHATKHFGAWSGCHRFSAINPTEPKRRFEAPINTVVSVSVLAYPRCLTAPRSVPIEHELGGAPVLPGYWRKPLMVTEGLVHQ
jgi:hypothetical protein